MESLQEKLEKMSLLELKGTYYDTQAAIQALSQQAEMINQQIFKKSKETTAPEGIAVNNKKSVNTLEAEVINDK